jgi:predicted 3-demethylubiquinone-9 3-methyltransferase (glyoxalase superfamily)
MTNPPATRPFTTCLWFDTEGEAAARFYTSVFPGSRLGRISRYTSAGPGPEGSVITVEFELNGQQFLALNGGPEHKFNEAISLQIPCADQAGVDYYWSALTEGGQEVVCGWLKDKFGLFWQVVPTILPDLLADPDPEKAARTTRAMFKMTKLDIKSLQAAYEGD